MIEVSGPVRLHVEEQGNGPALVLMHGFGGSARNLRTQARALRDTHRVIVFDARGHARSAAPEDPREYQPERFVEDVERVIDAAAVDRVVLGGISMGAAIALRFALSKPERLAGLVIAAFPPKGDASPGGYSMRFAETLERRGIEAAGAEFVWGHDRFDEKSRALIRQGFLEHAPHALAAIQRQVLAVHPAVEDMAPALGEMTVPTLVIVGSEDISSCPPSEALARAIPGARLVVIPDAGHVVNLEKPESFNGAIQQFLSGIEEGSFA